MARAGSTGGRRTVRLSHLLRSASLRWPALVLAFLALSIQNIVIQPHIHAQPADSALALEISDEEGGSMGDIPVDQAQTDCPICQSTNQHAQYLRPSSTAFRLPAFVNHRIVDIVLRPGDYQTVSHSWQGRAPPQA